MKDQLLPGMKRSYDDTAHGFVGVPHAKTETSKKAAEKVIGKAPAIRQRVWEFIHERGGQGATADEIGVALDLGSGTVCPRLFELREAGRIIKVKGTRLTRNGRMARVHVAVDELPDE